MTSYEQDNIDAAISFLESFHQGGLWVLTAIDIETRSLVTRTFHPKQIVNARTFLRNFAKSSNLYHQVNQPVRPLSKKARREEILELNYLHVDIDPRPGKDLEEERARAVRRLESFKLPPTYITDSGGGIHGYWRLEKPVQIHGDIQVAERAKLWNVQLELEFGADNCHNIDRIMRLPGTVNFPDAKKLSKGRIARLAQVIRYEPNNVYSVEQFIPAVPKPATAATPLILSPPPSDRRKVYYLEDLPDTIPDWVKVLIVQGNDPDHPNKYKSRSEALWAVVCALVKHEVSDEHIYGVITNDDFGISASVLDKPNWDAYALRQLTQARDNAIDPALHELNSKYAVIGSIGGRCRVYSRLPPGLSSMGRDYDLQTFDDFRNRLAGRRKQVVGADGKVLDKKLGHWWLEHPRRREYETLRFEPGRDDEIDGSLNLWRGFAVAPRVGDWSLIKSHIEEVLAAGDSEAAEYIFKWVAWCVQNPGIPAESALVFKGGRGTGKSTFGVLMKNMFGVHGRHLSSIEELTGRFNAQLHQCCFLFVDEVAWPSNKGVGNKNAEGTLKRLLTEPTLHIEMKGIDAFETKNCLRVVMASNEQWVIPDGHDERRFSVFKISEHRKGDEQYFAALRAQIDSGGLEAFLHELLTWPLGDWHPRRIYKTQALTEQKMWNLSPMDELWVLLLEEGHLPGASSTNPNFALTNALNAADGLLEYAKKAVPSLQDATIFQLARYLRAHGCRNGTTGARRGWWFPPLAEARAAWEKAYGSWPWMHPSVLKWGDPISDDVRLEPQSE